jgi:hypothetical protein
MKSEQAHPPNPCPFGTFVTEAAYAPSAPKASRDRRCGTFANLISSFFIPSTMNPPTQAHLDAVLQAHRQFDGDYCSVSALEFASKIYGLTPIDQFPLQSDPQNQSKGFDEQALQNLVSLKGHSAHYDIQSAVEAIVKETNQGKCVSVSLRGSLIFDQIVIPAGYHILVAVLQGPQPTLLDPATKQVLAQGKGRFSQGITTESGIKS